MEGEGLPVPERFPGIVEARKVPSAAVFLMSSTKIAEYLVSAFPGFMWVQHNPLYKTKIGRGEQCSFSQSFNRRCLAHRISLEY